MDRQTLTVGRYRLTVYSEAAANAPVVYLPLLGGDSAGVLSRLEETPVTLVVIEGGDWKRDFSPWPALAAFRGSEGFTGGADTFLDLLLYRMIPRADELLDYVPPMRTIAGYSLAGLFALYAVTRTDFFQRVACVSGSLWYDGFTEYLSGRFPDTCPERVYFSLGNREGRSQNPKIATVTERTEEVRRIFSEHGAETILETTRGGHFDHVPKRIARGIRWMLA